MTIDLIDSDDAEDFEWGDNDENLYITQHRYYRMGNILIKISELNQMNCWDNEEFDRSCNLIVEAVNASSS